MGFPGGSEGKESACNAGDLGSIPGLERSPREGKGYPFQYSGLENSITERKRLSFCIFQNYQVIYLAPLVTEIEVEAF